MSQVCTRTRSHLARPQPRMGSRASHLLACPHRAGKGSMGRPRAALPQPHPGRPRGPSRRQKWVSAAGRTSRPSVRAPAPRTRPR
eukprot:scaffold216094_cov32-Tisochrysis_lutea.AAC.3